MRTLVLSIIYFATGILFLLTENYSSFPAALILKTLMIPALILIFIINLKPGDNFLHKFMLAGLFLPWAGEKTLLTNEVSGYNYRFCFLVQELFLTCITMWEIGKEAMLPDPL